MSTIDLLFQKDINEIIQYSKTIQTQNEINEFLQKFADNCRDDENERKRLVNKELFEFILTQLENENNQITALQTCRCIVNITYYNEEARNVFIEIGTEKLKKLTKIIQKYEDLRMVGISCYANLFESNEKLQQLLIDKEMIESLELCLDDYYTSIIRLLNNLSSLNEMNEIFKSKFFIEFMKRIPIEFEDSDLSECIELFISIFSYTEFRKILCQYPKRILDNYRKAIDIIVNPLFPKNVEEEDLNQVCLGIKLILDFISEFYKYPDSSKLYESIIDLTIAYTLHGNIYDKEFIPAPTQNHTCEIICHMATIDEFLPIIWNKHEDFIKLSFDTIKNTRMMDYQKHCIGILQSFSTNEEYVECMMNKNILEKLSSIFTEETLMNQPLIHRSLSILQNISVLIKDKNKLCNNYSLNMILTTFKHMSNIVIRFGAVQCLRNLITFKNEFVNELKDEGFNVLIDVCLGKDEMQEKPEQPDKRVRYEATRILIKVLHCCIDYFNNSNRKDDIFNCLLENLKTDYAVLIKEVMEIILYFNDKSILIPNNWYNEIKMIVGEKLNQILTSPQENQLLNKDILDLFEKFLDMKK